MNPPGDWRGRIADWLLAHIYLFIWLPECALIAIVLWIGHAVSLGFAVSLDTVAWPALSWSIVRVAGRARLPDHGRFASFAGVLAGWLLAWTAYERLLKGPLSRMHLVMAAGIFAGMAFMRWWRSGAPRLAFSESCRLVSVTAGGLWLVRAFLSPAYRGAGDAQCYANMTADMQAQVRAGVFPVFVGQSIHQFNGATYPLRVAPGFQYLGAFLDAATLRSLDPMALQNLLLATLGAGSAVMCYLCMVALIPARRWLACPLALLFLACPGVLGLLYNGDLYMTWTTVPLVPLVIFGSVRSFRSMDFRSVACLSGGLGLLWWGHTPVAVWMTGFVVFAQAVRLILRRPFLSPLWREAAGLAVVLLIAAYPLLSVLVYTSGTALSLTVPEAIITFIKEAFPAVLLPVSELGRVLGDFQLGYSCWLLGLLALGISLWKRTAAVWVLLAASLVLILLLTPVPGLNLFLWRAVPEAVRDITGIWAMYRLYLILACTVIFAAWLAFDALLRTAPAFRFVVYPIAAGMCVWSAMEADKFILTGWRGPASGREVMMPENVPLTRYAYTNFPVLPDYYTHGVTEPHLEARLLRLQGLRLLAGDLESLEDGSAAGSVVVQQGPLQANPSEIPIYHYLPKATVQPRRHYAALFDFKYPAATAVLVVHGQTMFRIYALPEYGGPKSFGAAPGHPRLLPLWTDGATPEDIQFEFRVQGTWASKDLSYAGTFRLIEYDPAQLPVEVTSFIPYRAVVHAPEASWLETPRMYQKGYQALVDGRRAEVRKSPSALAMVRVPQGASSVKLQYYPPAGLVAAFWASFCTALALSVAALASLGSAARPAFDVSEPGQTIH